MGSIRGENGMFQIHNPGPVCRATGPGKEKRREQIGGGKKKGEEGNCLDLKQKISYKKKSLAGRQTNVTERESKQKKGEEREKK